MVPPIGIDVSGSPTIAQVMKVMESVVFTGSNTAFFVSPYSTLKYGLTGIILLINGMFAVGYLLE
jgi:hypothetical protein